MEREKRGKLAGAHLTDVAGYWEVLFAILGDPVYLDIAGGTACRVLVNGQGLELRSMRSPHWFPCNLFSLPGSVICCLVYSICPAWSPESC